MKFCCPIIIIRFFAFCFLSKIFEIGVSVGLLDGTFDIFLACAGENTSMMRSHKDNAGRPSIRVPASKAMISASEVLCETAPCFLHAHATGATVFGPKMHSSPPGVDLESWRSPAYEASWHEPSVQSLASRQQNNINYDPYGAICKPSNFQYACHVLYSIWSRTEPRS